MNTPTHHHYANERHHRAKLSDADVKLIRQLRRRYGLPYHAIAEKFECGTSTVRDIIKQRTRPHPVTERSIHE